MWHNNCVRHGGAIYAECVHITLTNNTLRENNASKSYHPGYGGGLYVLAKSINLTNNNILGNSGSKGGGVYTSSGYYTYADQVLRNNTIRDNHSVYRLPGDGRGGGIYADTLLDYYSNILIEMRNNIIIDNRADTYGGGIYIDIGGIMINNQ